MEVYCTKQLANSGTLEYKMIKTRCESADLGALYQYGIRVKFTSPSHFDYYALEGIASKPQTVLQIIKHLFDANVLPEQVSESIESFLKSV